MSETKGISCQDAVDELRMIADDVEPSPLSPAHAGMALLHIRDLKNERDKAAKSANDFGAAMARAVALNDAQKTRIRELEAENARLTAWANATAGHKPSALLASRCIRCPDQVVLSACDQDHQNVVDRCPSCGGEFYPAQLLLTPRMVIAVKYEVFLDAVREGSKLSKSELSVDGAAKDSAFQRWIRSTEQSARVAMATLDEARAAGKESREHGDTPVTFTVAELRKAIEGLPGKMEVIVRTEDADDNSYCGTIGSIAVQTAHDDNETRYLAIDCGPDEAGDE